MMDEAPFDPDVDQPSLGLDQARGIRMLEVDSYDRVIDGLKQAAEGARNAACHRHGDAWNRVADTFYKLRIMMSRLGAMNRPSDTVLSKVIFGAPKMQLVASYMRIHEGLKGAAAGARQLASCHRGDLRWTLCARQMDELQKKCSVLVRMKQHTAPRLILPH